MSVLVVRDLQAGYGNGRVIGPVDLTIGPGELVALVGPNGAGKTTLVRAIAGLVRSERGTVRVDGDDVATLSRAEVARRVAVVPQVTDGPVFPFTVHEVVALGRVARLGALGAPSDADAAAVRDAMDDLGLGPLADRRIDGISGGERQRVVVAMALAQRTPLLLLDEPTVHLDPTHQRDVLALVARLARSRGIAVMAVLHDLDLAALAPRMLVMAAGLIVRDGAPADVLDAATVGDVFGPGLEVIDNGGRRSVVPAPL